MRHVEETEHCLCVCVCVCVLREGERESLCVFIVAALSLFVLNSPAFSRHSDMKSNMEH